MLYLLRSYGKDGKSILKIGYAKDVKARFSQYQTCNPYIELLEQKEGSFEDEKILHLYLHALNYGIFKDEWYKDCSEVHDEFINFDPNTKKVRSAIWDSRSSLFNAEFVSRRDTRIINLYFNLYNEFGQDLIPVKISKLDEKTKKIIEIESNGTELDEKLYGIFWSKFHYLQTSEISKYNYLNNLVHEFDNLVTTTEKLKYLFNLKNKLDEQKILVFLERIPIKFKNYYTVIGPDRFSALKYNIPDLEREYQRLMNNQDIDISSVIYSNFKEGEKYLNVELREKISKLYESVGYKKVPRANDIEKYFEVREYKVTNKETKKRDHGFELIKKKGE